MTGRSRAFVSRAPDYLRFCLMLWNGGELEGVCVLSAQSVKGMTKNALPPGIRLAGVNGIYVGPAASRGLGFAIRANPVQPPVLSVASTGRDPTDWTNAAGRSSPMQCQTDAVGFTAVLRRTHERGSLSRVFLDALSLFFPQRVRG